jgi:hypothetical protein
MDNLIPGLLRMTVTAWAFFLPQFSFAADCVSRCSNGVCTTECPSEIPLTPSSTIPNTGIPRATMNNTCRTDAGICSIPNVSRIPAGTPCACQSPGGMARGLIQ